MELGRDLSAGGGGPEFSKFERLDEGVSDHEGYSRLATLVIKNIDLLLVVL